MSTLFRALIIACFLTAAITLHAEADKLTALQQSLPTAVGEQRVDLLNALSKELWGVSAEEALRYATEAQLLAKTLGYRAGEANALRHMAVAKWYQDDYEAVLEYALEALSIFRGLDDKPGIAACLNTIATTYLNLKKFDEAESMYLEALEIARQIGDFDRQATVLQNLGTINIGRERFDKAMAYLFPALELARQHGSDLQVMTTLANVASVYRRTGEFDQAWQINLEVLQLARRTGSKAREADALSDLGHIALARKHYADAIDYLEQAKALSHQEGLKRTEADSTQELAETYQGKGDTAKAYALLQQYTVLREAMLNDESNQKVAELQVQYDLKQKQFELDKQQAELAANRKTLIFGAITIGLLTVLILVISWAYRAKQRSAIAMAELARTDSLTQLPNRRAATETLAKLKLSQARSGTTYAVMLLDIDHFKQVNDRYGHDVGDQALMLFSNIIRHAIREIDLAARWGGEEFLLVLPMANLAVVLDIAQRIRSQLAASPLLVNGESVSLTATFGVSALGKDGSIEATLKQADEALYRGKANGRNRIELDAELSNS